MSRVEEELLKLGLKMYTEKYSPRKRIRVPTRGSSALLEALKASSVWRQVRHHDHRKSDHVVYECTLIDLFNQLASQR